MDLFSKKGKRPVLKQPMKYIDVASLTSLEGEDYMDATEVR